jgi:transglutaminase-like putative cysteine protease
MRRLKITHNTRYEYAETVEFKTHKLHIRPREGHDIRIESSRLSITPNYNIRWERDIYGNSIALVDFVNKSPVLEIVSEVVVEHYQEQPMTFDLDESAQHYPFRYNPVEQIDLIPYQMAVFPQDYPILQKWLQKICKPEQKTNTVELLAALNESIASHFTYQVREEAGVQSPHQTIELGTGSCRDFAALFIEACRVFGFAARFVSGYFLPASKGSAENLNTHAWAEVYLPGSGWRGFDSTNATLAAGDHIAVAQHRHPEAVPPVSGSFVGKPEPLPLMMVNVAVEIL